MTEKTLKPGWRRVKFGDVVRLSKARSQDPLADGIERYVGLEHLDPGDLRIRSWGNVADGVTFTSVFQPGQVLFGICRYQQFEAANKIVERVLAGYPRKGLIWHFQGSGKSLLMVFAAQKLRMHAGLKNPTVLIVVDRIDLDSQITGAFTGADIPNLEKADTPSSRSCRNGLMR